MLSLAAGAALVVVSYPELHVSRAAICVLILLINLPAHYFNRVGRHRKALLISMGGLSFALTLGTWSNGGILAPAYLSFSIVMASVVWVIPRRLTAVVFSGWFCLGIGAVLAARTSGHGGADLPPPPVLLGLYGVIGMLVLSVLLTAQRMLLSAVSEATEQEALAWGVFHTVEEGILVLDDDMVPQDANAQGAAFEEQVRRAHAQLDHLKVVLRGREDTVRRLLDAHPAGFSDAIYEHQGDDGVVLHFRISCFPLLGFRSAGRTVLVVRDETSHLLAREQLEQAQKMEAAGLLASGIAHDFNNMLAGVSGAAAVLATSVPEEDRDMVDLIQQSVDRAAVLTKRLLVHGKRSEDSSDTCDLNEVLSQTIELLQRTVRPDVRITRNATVDACVVSLDAAVAQSILMNMGINAAHAMGSGGLLEYLVTLEDLEQEGAQRLSLQPGQYVRVRVRDNGHGIRAEHLPHVFEPFFTTKPEGVGTGIGLSAALAIVRGQSGVITVESAEGRGTEVDIWLPVADSAAVGSAVRGPRSPVERGSSVLIVDDEDLVLRSVSALLRREGFSVSTVSSGAAGLALMAETKVDVVLLDMLMPGMSGEEVFSRIRGFEDPPPVVIMTGFADPQALLEMQRQGVSSVLRKPCGREELLRALGGALA